MKQRTRKPKEFTSLMIDTDSRERLRKLAGSQSVASFIRNLTTDLLEKKPEKDPQFERMESEIQELRDVIKELWQKVLRLETRNLELNWLNHSWATLYAEERKKLIPPDSPEFQQCEELIRKSESSWSDFRNKVFEDYKEEK